MGVIVLNGSRGEKTQVTQMTANQTDDGDAQLKGELDYLDTFEGRVIEELIRENDVEPVAKRENGGVSIEGYLFEDGIVIIQHTPNHIDYLKHEGRFHDRESVTQAVDEIKEENEKTAERLEKTTEEMRQAYKEGGE